MLFRYSYMNISTFPVIIFNPRQQEKAAEENKMMLFVSLASSAAILGE